MSDFFIKQGEKCPTCGRYYDRHAVVDALIVKEGKIFLEKRNHEPAKGMWALVGGYVDWNETTEAAVVREVKEEIGVESEVIGLFGVYSDPNRDNNRNIQNVAIVYLLRLLSSTFQLNTAEVEEVQWFPLDALPDNIAFDHRKIIEDYKKLPHIKYDKVSE